ncbi:hypothetical protein GW17_00057378 [Ensete ventricosum]|nr:hypothetical protein GW17_00057378 [Ensete ventricosum]
MGAAPLQAGRWRSPLASAALQPTAPAGAALQAVVPAGACRPLRYPHNGSLQQSSSNLISQLLRRGREENRRWWLQL